MAKLPRTTIFAERLWEIADREGITVAEIGRRAGLPRCAINQYFTKDRHQPTLPIIVAIANAFGVSADYLCGLTNSTNISITISEDDWVIQ